MSVVDPVARDCPWIVAQCSLAGTRSVNEDATFVDAACGVFAVIDGAGGAGFGDRAATIVRECLAGATNLEAALQDAGSRLHALNQAAPGSPAMSATAVAARLADGQAEIVHVGEVRAYLLRGGRLQALTEDHTLATQLVKLKQLEPAAAARHPARKKRLRYLGQDALPRVDRRLIKLEPGDTLLLCTDGLHAALPVEALLDMGAIAAANVAEALETLLARATTADDSDNASAVAIRVVGETGGDRAPAADVRQVLQGLLASPAGTEALDAYLAPMLADVLTATGARQAVLVAVQDGHTLVMGEASHVGAAPALLSLARLDRLTSTPADEPPCQEIAPGIQAVSLTADASLPSGHLLLLLECPADAAADPLALAVPRARAPWLGVIARVMSLKDEGRRIARRFDILNDLGRAVASSLHLDDVLRVLLEQTLALTRANLAYVIMPAGGELTCRYGLDADGERVHGLEISRTIAGRVLADRQPVCIQDTAADESTRTPSVMSLNLQSVMCVPLVVKDELIGLLYVSSNSVVRAFTREDLELLIAIAGQTALSVQSALYVHEMEEKKRMEAQLERIGKEMEIAQRIQAMLVPSELAAPGFDLAMAQVTATEVGGDLIDYLPQPDGRFWLAIGDVTGHDLSSGLIMMMAQSMFTGLVTARPDDLPSTHMSALNWALYHNVRDRVRSDHYMTLQLVHHLGHGSFVAAGMHCEVLIHRAASRRVECFEVPGTWTGFLPDVWELTADYYFSLDPGDTLLLYTDGLIEAMNRQGEQFDLHRLEVALARLAGRPVREVVIGIVEEVLGWVHDQRDDLSLIVLTRIPEPPPGRNRPPQAAGPPPTRA